MIDIIIPAFNAHETIERTLFSIAYQKQISLANVYIVNDGSDEDYSKEIKFFSKFLKIKELKMKKNSGPGCARQYGIDHSESEYIIFIDSDDVFYDPYVVSNLYNTIISENYDLVISNFYEKIDNDFLLRKRESTFLHGKIYKRSFLEKNNIKFNDSRNEEDNGFNQLLLLCNPKTICIDLISIIWCDYDKSITRKDDYAYTKQSLGIKGYTFNIEWAIEEGIKRNCDEEKISKLAYSALIELYYKYLQNQNDEVIKCTKNIYNLTNKHPLSEQDKKILYEEVFDCSLNDYSRMYLLNPCVSFEEFINLVKEQVI